ncbi:hypothetical protein OG592_27230 [Streptomyces avidinii]|uniref:hypothetical protein n=1 Tax=Streptomyces avidinii TaxID=1895 RepID=UPI00386F3A1C|nr:hypothetical protein OG592_27230 [Streptomyces avidinii]
MTETRHTVDTITPEALEQLYARIEDWRTAAGANMTLTDQLRGQLEQVRRVMADTGLITDTPPDSDASLAMLLKQGLDEFWARMKQVDDKADKQLEELADAGRQFKSQADQAQAWGEQQKERASRYRDRYVAFRERAQYAEAAITTVRAIADRWARFGSTDLRTAARILDEEVLAPLSTEADR